MIFHKTKLKDAFIAELDKKEDHRGSSESILRKGVSRHSFHPQVLQANMSYRHKRGTVLGMHYQVPQGE